MIDALFNNLSLFSFIHIKWVVMSSSSFAVHLILRFDFLCSHLVSFLLVRHWNLFLSLISSDIWIIFIENIYSRVISSIFHSTESTGKDDDDKHGDKVMEALKWARNPNKTTFWFSFFSDLYTFCIFSRSPENKQPAKQHRPASPFRFWSVMWTCKF